jgi:hypothetical protein
MKKLALLSILLCLAFALALSAEEKAATGALKIATPDVELQLKVGDAVRSITSKDGEMTLDAGTYAPVALRILKRETVGEGPKAKESAWILSSKGPWGGLAAVKIEAGKTTTLSPGQPVTLKADVQQQGDAVTIGCVVVGAAGEQYSPAVTKDGQPQSAPSLKIVDESGKVLDSGAFQFG